MGIKNTIILEGYILNKVENDHSVRDMFIDFLKPQLENAKKDGAIEYDHGGKKKDKPVLTKTQRRHLGMVISGDPVQNIKFQHVKGAYELLVSTYAEKTEFLEKFNSHLKKEHSNGVHFEEELNRLIETDTKTRKGAHYIKRPLPEMESWKYSNPGGRYTNLFDDELYSVHNFIENSNTIYKDHLNTIRYQVLLAILFDEPIIVPEQWAVSSATFMQVAGEVANGLEGRSVIEKPISERNRDKIVKARLPFAISYINKNRFESKSAYFDAFLNRLNGHNVKLTGRLSEKYCSEHETHRENFSNYIKNIYQKIGDVCIDWARIEDELTEILDCRQTALNFASVCRYVSSHSSINFQFSEEKYFNNMAQNVGDVENAVCRDPLLKSSTDSEMEQFRDFFYRVTLEGYPLHKIMGMWQQFVPKYDGSGRALIERMGRYVMHDALSKSVGANYNSDFGNTFDPSNKFSSSEKLGLDIINSICQSKNRGYPNTNGRGFDYDIISLANNTDQYNLSNIKWKAVWQSVWSFVESEEWHKLKTEINDALIKCNLETIHEHDIWPQVFEAINQSVHFFHIALYNHDTTHFVITMPIPIHSQSFENISEDVAVNLSDIDLSDNVFIGPLAMLARMANISIPNLHDPATTSEGEEHKGCDMLNK